MLTGAKSTKMLLCCSPLLSLSGIYCESSNIIERTKQLLCLWLEENCNFSSFSCLKHFLGTHAVSQPSAGCAENCTFSMRYNSRSLSKPQSGFLYLVVFTPATMFWIGLDVKAISCTKPAIYWTVKWGNSCVVWLTRNVNTLHFYWC